MRGDDRHGRKGDLVELKRIVVAFVCGLPLALPASASAAAGSGGAYASEPARIASASCIARCAGVDAAKAGSLLRVRGTSMRDVAKLVFLGGRGDADNVTTRVLKARLKSVDVVVPEKALSGRMRAVNGDGARSQASRATVSVLRGDASSSALDVRVVGRQVFVGAARPAQVDLLARRAMAVTVGVVRVADGVPVAAWPVALVPEVVTSVTWDGTVAGVPQPPGRYEFRVSDGAAQPGVVAAQAPAALANGVFDLVDHKFPVRGAHNYGGAIATFGQGRDGHTHEGQDVFARCGTPLVAARSGVVKLNRFESSAGNYLVIDGDGTDVDYVYMHMQKPSPALKGAHVLTGQSIGKVGDTGDANGCHLHFEMWAGPGWYTGGAPFDPLPQLKAWDAYS